MASGGGDCYTHGYHPAIVKSYTWRTAETCAGFLLAELRSDAAVLDVGCGPGTISVGLARRAAQPDGFWAWLNGEVLAVAPPA